MPEAPRFILCPYCGHPQPTAERCGVCGGHFEPLSRKATQISMGPWFIRDRNVPFRPGCSFEVLRKQIEAGRIKPNTVLRGPTTHQFWSVARNTPGVAHLLGYCHECNQSVKPTDAACPRCKTKFTAPSQRNEMGLLYPTADAAARAQKALDRSMDRLTGSPGPSASASASQAESGEETRAPVQGGIDLLDQVLSVAEKRAMKAQPAAQTAKAPAAPKADRPTSLDFTPATATGSGEAKPKGEAGFLWQQHPQEHAGSHDHPPTAAVPASTGGSTNWLVWVLVASNIIVVALLALAVWILRQPQG